MEETEKNLQKLKSGRIEMKVTFTNLMIAVHYVQIQNSAFSSSLEWRVLMDETVHDVKSPKSFSAVLTVVLIRKSDSMLLKNKVF